MVPVGDRPPSSRSGFTLTEAILVVSVISILALLAIPRIERVLAARDLVSARAATSALLLRARGAAVEHRQPVLFTVNGGDVSASVTTPGGAVVVGVVQLRSQFGVRVTAPEQSLVISPAGLIQAGTPFVMVMRRASLTDSLQITGFGRVQ